ncbi:DUF1326 domain-containing protein [Phytoactinopolyspora halotolerans]|uniref:DUF1326 domain-containing protein n=1 Tax=Phytoactinopolyspora halotolerans TaxID=1981512 RepID=A0A6L9S8T0_9ACTN|nr:DUF1326 domain-containing protein [Phytoactinopolyspora halotolerans]NEE01835.1 DUF1326 domain-containing protein [Phytoactinopolyspora halotolerans]
MTEATLTTTQWRIAGESVGSCNCNGACPCQFAALPTEGNCEAITVWQISEGHFGSTDMAGVRFAEAFFWPGAVHEGGGTRLVILDSASADAQRDAVLQLTSGRHGHPFFEIFASVTPNVPEPVVASIELEIDRDARHAKVDIPGIIAATVAPIRNPVTGDEHRARIDLPNGFEFKRAEVANSVNWQVTADSPLTLQHENTYSHLYSFDWSSDGSTG